MIWIRREHDEVAGLPRALIGGLGPPHDADLPVPDQEFVALAGDVAEDADRACFVSQHHDERPVLAPVAGDVADLEVGEELGVGGGEAVVEGWEWAGGRSSGGRRRSRGTSVAEGTSNGGGGEYGKGEVLCEAGTTISTQGSSQ